MFIQLLILCQNIIIFSNLYGKQWKNCVEPFNASITKRVPHVRGQILHTPAPFPLPLPPENVSLWYTAAKLQVFATNIGHRKAEKGELDSLWN